MSDTENDNKTETQSEETPVKTKSLFGTKQSERPLHNLGENLGNDPEFRDAAGLNPIPVMEPSPGEVQPTVIENEMDNNQMMQMNENADQVAVDSTVETPVVETPVDGSQADLVADVSAELQDHVQGANVAPETALEEAPAAVSVEAAAAAAADNAAQTLAAPTATSDGNTIEQLRAEQDRINRELAEKTTAERAAVIAQIKTVVDTYNIPVAELVEALGGLKNKRVGSKAKPKYRNPADGAEWSGRGREPLWIKGKDRTPFTITE